MTYDQALAFYKTQSELAKALRLSRGRVTQLKDQGGFSYPTQCVLEKHSKRKLIARYEDVPQTKTQAA